MDSINLICVPQPLEMPLIFTIKMGLNIFYLYTKFKKFYVYKMELVKLLIKTKIFYIKFLFNIYQNIF